MPYCPHCKYEYLPEIKICPDCNAELVDDLTNIPTDGPDIQWQNTEVIAQYNNYLDAQAARLYLEAHGIRAFIQETIPGRFLTIKTKVQVPMQDASRARALLDNS